MNLIDQQLEKIKAEKRIGLMTHVVVGYPELNATEKLIQALIDAGSDFIELQIPFSDPIGDGPTIMMACDKAIHNGANVQTAMKVMQKMAKISPIPLLFMCYYNTVFQYGVEKFCREAKEVGASAVIIPDVPPEEESQEHLLQQCKKNGLYSIRVISPASSTHRLQVNAKVSQGFIYCASRFGVTGAKSDLAPELKTYLKQVRKYFSIPVAVGFGISNKEHVQALRNDADIAVVGSALIDIIKENKDYLAKIKQFVKELL